MTKSPENTKRKAYDKSTLKTSQIFDYTTVAYRLRTVSCNNRSNKTGVINLLRTPTFQLLTTAVGQNVEYDKERMVMFGKC